MARAPVERERAPRRALSRRKSETKTRPRFSLRGRPNRARARQARITAPPSPSEARWGFGRAGLGETGGGRGACVDGRAFAPNPYRLRSAALWSRAAGRWRLQFRGAGLGTHLRTTTAGTTRSSAARQAPSMLAERKEREKGGEGEGGGWGGGRAGRRLGDGKERISYLLCISRE